MNIKRLKLRVKDFSKRPWKIVSSFTDQNNGTTSAVYYTFMREKEAN